MNKNFRLGNLAYLWAGLAVLSTLQRAGADQQYLRGVRNQGARAER